MVDWKDPRVMAVEAVDFNNVVHVFFGLYIWELILSSHFEISLIQGKRKAGWPLVSNLRNANVSAKRHMLQVPFFLCRYGMLWALVGLIISLNVSTKVNCGALYTFISVAGNTTIASASTSLMIRTLALWEWERWVTITIGILSLGQWGILIRSMNVVEAIWDESVNTCVVNNANHLLLNLNYFYTMGFDFIILMFTSLILGRYTRERGGLSSLLFRDGLIYFMVTSLCNTIPAVLNLLNLNDEMNVIATVPAATTSAVAACRAVVRLKEYGERSNSYSIPTLNIISTVASRYRKSSHQQTHRRTNAFSFDGLGTTSSSDLDAPKSPTHVEWKEHVTISSAINKAENQLVSSKHEPIVSVV